MGYWFEIMQNFIDYNQSNIRKIKRFLFMSYVDLSVQLMYKVNRTIGHTAHPNIMHTVCVLLWYV